MFMDISDFDGISDIKPAYMDIVKELEFIPQDGVHALPYVANCAGILYNKDMFEENRLGDSDYLERVHSPL